MYTVEVQQSVECFPGPSSARSTGLREIFLLAGRRSGWRFDVSVFKYGIEDSDLGYGGGRNTEREQARHPFRTRPSHVGIRPNHVWPSPNHGSSSRHSRGHWYKGRIGQQPITNWSVGGDGYPYCAVWRAATLSLESGYFSHTWIAD